MTRDARLSALHRGDFGLPGPRFRLLRRPPPYNGGQLPCGSVQRAPRTQVVVPGGRGPEPPEASGYEPPAAGRHSPLRANFSQAIETDNTFGGRARPSTLPSTPRFGRRDASARAPI